MFLNEKNEINLEIIFAQEVCLFCMILLLCESESITSSSCFGSVLYIFIIIMIITLVKSIRLNVKLSL